MKVVFPVALLVAASFTGCLGWLFGDGGPPVQANTTVDPGIPDDIGRLVSGVLTNYSFPAQAALPWVTAWFNGTVGPETNAAVENVRDDGGTDLNGVVRTMDVTPFLPPGQPTEIAIRLFWNAAEGNSADLDIYVDVPGTTTSTGDGAEELNFNIPSKTLVVNTVGVAGYAAKIGVQGANGRTTSDLAFTVEMAFSYAKDVFTPAIPYAIPVPQNATGLILESVKAAGDEHVTARFVILDPTDAPIAYMEYNDIAIPTESVFIPVNGPGDYVFYAYDMRGGFLSAKADVGLKDTHARPLSVKEERVVDASAPAPGVVGRNWLAPNPGGDVPLTGGSTVDVNFPKFPLAVRAFIDAAGQGGATGMCQIQITSPKGLVASATRIARVDSAQGSVGYTDDEGQNNVFNPGNVTAGPYKITIVNNGNGALGHTVLSYTR